MRNPLQDVFKHNSWANVCLLDYLRTLNNDQLSATTEAVYGNILSTMQHLLGGEASYWAFFSGRQPNWAQSDDVPAILDQLRAWAIDIGPRWDDVLSTPIDGEAWVERKRRDGSVSRMKAGIVLAQCIHHGNVHREQVSHILTTLGHTPPDLSLYAYASEIGSITRSDSPPA